MVLNLSDFKHSGYYENRDLSAQSSSYDHDKTGNNISRKKHRRIRTDEGDDDDQDNTEQVRKKKMKQNSLGTEVDSSSSDQSCFVALVTASNLQKDALHLPQDLTSSVGLQRKSSEIVVTDERERSWPLDLRFSKSSDTFYISRGWRSFFDENGKKAGGVFVFKLVRNRETPVLSFCSTESTNDGTQGDKNNKENCMQLERKKKRMRFSFSTSQSQNRFVTLTLTHNNLKRGRRYLPLPFTSKNGLDKPGMITLLGKAGMKWEASLHREASGRMALGKGWNDFVKANRLRSGKSFTLEAISEKGTPMLRLCSTQSTSDKSQQGECSKDSEKESISAEIIRGNKNRRTREESRDSSLAIQNRSVTLTLTPEDVRDCKLILPSQFMKASGINKLGKITLLGQLRIKWFAYLLSRDGIVALGSGWKGFCEANGVKTGDSFNLECINEQNTTPVIKFCSNSDP